MPLGAGFLINYLKSCYFISTYIVLPPINDNGHYVKFESGLLVCFHQGGQHTGVEITISRSFPFAFKEIPLITSLIHLENKTMIFKQDNFKVFARLLSNNSFNAVFRTYGGGSPYYQPWSIQYTAIGFWK